MSYTPEQWKEMQSNGAEPFRSNVESNINEITEIVTLKENVVIAGMDVVDGIFPEITIGYGIAVKDNTKLRLTQDIILDFENMNDYFDSPSSISEGYKIIALKYTYVLTRPAPYFEIKILDSIPLDTTPYLFLKVVEVLFNGGTYSFGDVLDYLPSDPTYKRQYAKTQIPPGGLTNQVITKLSDEDYDFTWANGGGGGGGAVNTIKNNVTTVNLPSTALFSNLYVGQYNATTAEIRLAPPCLIDIEKLLITNENEIPYISDEICPYPETLKIYRNGKLELNDDLNPGHGAYKLRTEIVWNESNSGYDLEPGMDVIFIYPIADGSGGVLKFITERKEVTVLNESLQLSYIPYDLKLIRMSVNGKQCINNVIDPINYDFESNNHIFWNPTNSSTLNVGEKLYAEYMIVNRLGIDVNLTHELLEVTALNTLSPLSQTPIHPEAVMLYINGKFEVNDQWATGEGSFSVSGNTITWNSTNAEYDLEIGMTAFVIYYF